MRPIEPGCLVVVLHAQAAWAIGRTGVVQGLNEGPFIGRHTGELVLGEGWWNVDIGSDAILCRPASSLLRIDGGEDEAESVTEQHDEEVSA